jgi:hypothetical protein
MFTEKQKSLFEVPVTKRTTSTNAFVNAGLKKSAETLSGNSALKYSTTGNDFVDQFGKLGTYKEQRSFDSISQDSQLLYSKNLRLAICFIFFIRMITRVVSLFDGIRTQTVQRGSGLKHEGIMRMIWLHINHPDHFWANIRLYLSIASWKDIFQMLQYDLEYNGWDNRKLDWTQFGQLIMAGLENPHTLNLVKKYLPQIKARSKCTTLQSQADTIIGKWICSILDIDYKKYRKLKTSGTAHDWQKKISQNLYDTIDFSTIHGRALALLVSSKFISNHGLEDKYERWIKVQPIAKFTGYVHELMSKVTSNMKPYLTETINKQFMGLVETGKKNAKTDSSLIVVRDTSSSMGGTAQGTKVSCYDIGKALALYFSEFLSGFFADSWIEFNDKAKMHTWKGSTPVDKWLNDDSSYVGSTNFQSVVQLFCQIKARGIPESEFPTSILCISDGEFNPAQLGKTNVDVALVTLRAVGFSEDYVSKFKIILWNLQSGYYGRDTGSKFETYGNVDNVYYFSGYDGSIIAFLTGVDKQEKEPKNAEELFEAAMNQEIMNMIQV